MQSEAQYPVSSGLALVTGGTGTLGRLVVRRLRDAGLRVRILSRSSHENGDGIEYVVGDLDKGVPDASIAQGVDIVVHCAGSNSGDGRKARNLVRALAGSPVRHLVYISVVGADRVPMGYFTSKLDGERIVAESGIPWTTLRATQFHDLVLLVARAMGKLPVVPVPKGIRFQPIEAAEVADRMTELALGEPAGLVADIAGPRIYELRELIGGYLAAAGKRRPIVSFPLAGKGARALKAGDNLAPEHAVGRRTWEDFLAERARVPATR